MCIYYIGLKNKSLCLIVIFRRGTLFEGRQRKKGEIFGFHHPSNFKMHGWIQSVNSYCLLNFCQFFSWILATERAPAVGFVLTRQIFSYISPSDFHWNDSLSSFPGCISWNDHQTQINSGWLQWNLSNLIRL